MSKLLIMDNGYVTKDIKTVFQLIDFETIPNSGDTTITITTPNIGNILVYRNGIKQSGNYSYNESTGVITFDDAFDGSENVLVVYIKSLL